MRSSDFGFAPEQSGNSSLFGGLNVMITTGSWTDHMLNCLDLIDVLIVVIKDLTKGNK